jgi:hypothetical protein
LTATVAAISGNGAEPGDDLQSACWWSVTVLCGTGHVVVMILPPGYC